jgi:hypothetical protein
MCYRIGRPFSPVGSVFVNNGFGPGTLSLTRPDELCVPSVVN